MSYKNSHSVPARTMLIFLALVSGVCQFTSFKYPEELAVLSSAEWRVLDFFTLSLLATVAFLHTRRWKIMLMSACIAVVTDILYQLMSTIPVPHCGGANFIGAALAALAMIIVSFRTSLQQSSKRQPALAAAPPMRGTTHFEHRLAEHRLVRRPLPDGTSKIFAYKLPRR